MKGENGNLIATWQKLAAYLLCVAISCAIVLSDVMDVSWNRVDCMNVLLVVSLHWHSGLLL